MSSLILRFSGSYNFAALAVKAYTWSWCSHVEVELTQFNMPVLYGAHPFTGVDYRPITATDGDRVERYEVQLPNEAVREAIIQKLLSQRGKPYDYTAVLGLAIHRDWGRDDSKWFCSELDSWAFDLGGFPLVRIAEKDRITPCNLLLCPYLVRLT